MCVIEDQKEFADVHYTHVLWWNGIQMNKSKDVQGGSQKLLLTTKESIVSSSIFSGPPCISKLRRTRDIWIFSSY